MMATATCEFSDDGQNNLPPLSPNLEASQLLTPLQLGRITIDNPHYHDHLVQSMLAHQQQSVLNPVPDHQHVLHRRTAKLGDNYFFLQKDIPIAQTYTRTALKLSDVRPWDQTVERPLNSQKVINKEVHLPFPQEHPYTSHISRFAVFPDTKSSLPLTKPDGRICEDRSAATDISQGGHHLPGTVDAHTQTLLTSLKPLPTYYVPQKAGEWGLRVEEHYLGVPGMPSLNPDVGRTFWDLPRSKQHKRANTYPAPRFLYSTQLPDTPAPHSSLSGHSTLSHIQPPASQSTTPPITPRTNNALESIHKLLTRSTTYSEHFPHHRQEAYGSTNQQNLLRLDYSLRSCVSQRPWTNESRGKYCRRIPMSPRVEPGGGGASEAEDTDTLGASDRDEVVFSLLKGAETSEKGEESSENRVPNSHKTATSTGESQDTQNATSNAIDRSDAQTSDHKNTSYDDEETFTGHGRKTMVNSCTQTEEEYFDPAPSMPPRNQHGTMITDAQKPHTRYNRLPRVGCGPSGQLNVEVPMSNCQPTAPRLRMMSNQLPRGTADVSQLVKYPSAKRPLSAVIDSTPSAYNATLSQNSKHLRSFSADASLCTSLPQVRTADSTKRLMSLYNGFNRTEVMKRFHDQHPERAPDLRVYSIREGRRHVIHGSHAYYFH